MYGTSKDVNELWVPLIEKAYAKLCGCYQQLISGYADDGIMDLTSLVSEKRNLYKGGFWDEKAHPIDEFWNYLED